MLGMPPKTNSRIKVAGTNFKREFIEMCIREVAKEGYQGTSLKSISWNRIIEECKKMYNVTYDQRQLKNQWDYQRKCYATWKFLENKTGHGYNPETGTFDWLDDVWNDMIKARYFLIYFLLTTYLHI